MSYIINSKVKHVTAEEAVKVIKSGDRVYVHSNSAYPKALVDAMVKRKDELTDVEVCHLMVLGDTPYIKPEMEGHFRHNAMFLGGNTRKAINEGRGDYMPIFLSDIPALIKNKNFKINVCLLHLSPPDNHGYCSFGVAVEASKAASEVADVIIAQINPNMPRVLGDSFIHISKIDYAVEVNEELQELEDYTHRKTKEELDVFRKIGENIATLVEDEATLQMGIGAIPDAVLKCLDDRKNLGIHTEMFSDGIIPLIENGVITCEKKTLLPDKVVTLFVLGSRKLFKFIENNPLIEMRPSDFVNNPFNIARNKKVVAINAALQVDLSGQVTADQLGMNCYSGFGGQVDFIRGAARSQGGQPIIALPSSAKNNTISKIVPMLKEGETVTTSRGDVHFVVTEYGIADLHGLNLRQRALALIEIAHPNFRDDLKQFAKKRKFI